MVHNKPAISQTSAQRLDWDLLPKHQPVDKLPPQLQQTCSTSKTLTAGVLIVLKVSWFVVASKRVVGQDYAPCQDYVPLDEAALNEERQRVPPLQTRWIKITRDKDRLSELCESGRLCCGKVNT